MEICGGGGEAPKQNKFVIFKSKILNYGIFGWQKTKQNKTNQTKLIQTKPNQNKTKENKKTKQNKTA